MIGCAFFTIDSINGYRLDAHPLFLFKKEYTGTVRQVAMSLRRMFSSNREDKKVESEQKNDSKIEGKIIHLGSGGWGFITSESLPYTRMFFHWTTLEGDTLRFPDLRKGMRVKFIPQLRNDGSYRALKISVIQEEKKDE